MIRIKINDVYGNLLIDSGSTISGISEAKAQELGVQILPLDQNETKFLIAANRSRVEKIGRCSLNLKFNTRTVTFDFIVLRQLSTSVLVGLNFLEKFGVQQNFGNGTLEIMGEEVPLIRSQNFLGLARMGEDSAYLSWTREKYLSNNEQKMLLE